MDLRKKKEQNSYKGLQSRIRRSVPSTDVQLGVTTVIINAIEKTAMAAEAYKIIVIPVTLEHGLLQLGLLFEYAPLSLLRHLMPVGFDDEECEYDCN